MVKAIRAGMFALVLMAGEASAQFCPGLPPWVFDDVAITHPFCTDITWMAQRGVTLGCALIDPNHRLYCPNANVDRGQMAAFMHRLASNAAFQRDGNAWGATAVLGTTDAQAVEVIAGGSRVMRFHMNGIGANASPNLLGGHPNNTVSALHVGQTVAGGGMDGDDCFNPLNGTSNRSCANHVTIGFGTVSGGIGNLAVGGTVAGGELNTAYFGAFAAGGARNTASGSFSFAAGYAARADQSSCFVFGGWASGLSISCLGVANIARFGLDHGLSVDYFSRRADGGGTRWVYIGDIFGGQTIATWTGAFLSDAGVWVNAASSKDAKTDFVAVDAREVLERVAALPITTWRYRAGEGEVRHIGPMAEDFHAAFDVGYGPHTIADLDARGVALAAIQGLNAKVESAIGDRDAQLAAQAREIAALKEQLSAVRAIQGEVVALKAALAELQRERAAVAAR